MSDGFLDFDISLLTSGLYAAGAILLMTASVTNFVIALRNHQSRKEHHAANPYT